MTANRNSFASLTRNNPRGSASRGVESFHQEAKRDGSALSGVNWVLWRSMELSYTYICVVYICIFYVYMLKEGMC